MPNYQQLLDAALDRAQATIDRIESESGADLQGVSWEPRSSATPPRARSPTPPARARRTRSSSALRGYGRARALLGSVAHELIHLADCPITVIPERVVDRKEPRDGGSGVMSYEDSPIPPRDAVTPPPPDTRWLQTPVRAFMRPGVS